MALGGFKLFGMLQRRMDWLGDRQRGLSQNVANSDTPHYAARDLKPLKFGELVQGTAPVGVDRTDAAHFTGRPTRTSHAERTTKATETITLSENAVDLEAELRKVSETTDDSPAMVKIYTNPVDMIRTAPRRNV